MITTYDLSGKTILVTGASSGIGKQVAQTISRSGGKVVIHGRDQDRLKETFDKLEGKGHVSITAELTIDEEIEKFTDALPQIDGIVHCAGISLPFPVKFIKSRHIDKVLRINYYAPVLITGQTINKKKMRDGGSIVFLSTIATKMPYYGGAVYISSKCALMGYSMVLAQEMAPRRIRANCLLPGFVHTPMFETTLESTSKEAMKKFEDLHPFGFGDPEDVAGPVCFLLSDASRWITGTQIPLGGSL